jgi:arsenate reductase
VGIDIEGRKPSEISQDDVEWAELVVTMGCGDACPVLPGKRYVDWELPDPSEMSLDEVRKLRDEIDERVSRLGE